MVIELTQEKINFINKQIVVSREYSLYAEDLLKGIYKLQNGLDEIKFDRTPNWNYSHKISSNTYQLYLHTLNFNNSLVKKYIKSNDVKYIIKAKYIIEEWIKFNLEQNSKTNFAWYDHTVSSRIQNILYFQANAPKRFKIKKKKFVVVLNKHLDFLQSYKNYTENNHGIMMDKALLICSVFLDDYKLKEKYILLAKNRVEKAILRDYSYKNIHLENSPDYHRMVTNWLNKVVKILDEVNNPLNSKYKKKLKNAVAFNGIVSNYNNEYPMIGDTEHSTTRIKKNHSDFIDYEAGIGVFNNKKAQATLVFNCGYQNLTHKHFDDLSFTLSIEKEQIFVDSGKYNYNLKDPLRQHMLSALAHTTILVKDGNYDLYNEKPIEISSFRIGKDYKLIKGVHKAYKNVSIERIILVIDNKSYLILDNIKSKDENTYIQNFVLDDKVDLEIIGNRKYQLTTPLNKKYLLQEHSKAAAPKLFHGPKHNAVISKEFNQTKNTFRLEIRKKQRNSSFITSITPTDIIIKNINFADDYIVFEINGEKRRVEIN